jgi:hypothetical protein
LPVNGYAQSSAAFTFFELQVRMMEHVPPVNVIVHGFGFAAMLAVWLAGAGTDTLTDERAAPRFPPE